jgi:hypothetical protein
MDANVEAHRQPQAAFIQECNMVDQIQTLAELSEKDASGRKREIYEELRRLTGVPMVALIFRHLATHSGVLEQTWTAIEPVLRSGLLQEAAAKIAKQHASPALMPAIDANACKALGLDDASLRPVVNALDAYNRANPINLLTMLSLLARIDTATVAQPPVVQWTPPPPIPGPLSPMTAPADMPPHIRWLINDFGFGDRTQLDSIVPSLLRHLCETPTLLGVLHVVFVPRFRDGTLAAAIARLREALAQEAEQIAPSIAPIPLLESAPQVRQTLERFTGSWIPQMTIIGMALRHALTGFAN